MLSQEVGHIATVQIHRQGFAFALLKLDTTYVCLVRISPSMTWWKRPQNTDHTAISEWLNSFMVSFLLIDSSLFDTCSMTSSLVDLPTTQQPNNPKTPRPNRQSWPKYPLSSSEASRVKAPSLAHLRRPWDFRRRCLWQNLLPSRSRIPLVALGSRAYLLSAPSPPNHPGQQKACTPHTCTKSIFWCWWKCVKKLYKLYTPSIHRARFFLTCCYRFFNLQIHQLIVLPDLLSDNPQGLFVSITSGYRCFWWMLSCQLKSTL